MLAKIQARNIGTILANKYPDLSIEYHSTTTTADRDSTMSLAQTSSIGLFTKDISDKIINGQYDIAVHSWKDLPVEPSEKTEIIGTVDRGDMRDVLIIKRETAHSKRIKNMQILSSSPRRMYNLDKVLSSLVPFKFDNLTFLEVRGNIETRLKKFIQGNSDGIVMAKVAIDRILESSDSESKDFIYQVISNNKWLILPLSIFPTAPGQGAIAIEARKDRNDIKKIVKNINNKDVFEKVNQEKIILSKYGGGCQQKIGISIWSEKGHDICSMVGQTEQGIDIKKYDLLSYQKDKDIGNISEQLIYPSKKDSNLFYRNKIEVDHKFKRLKNSFIYFSRKNVIDKKSRMREDNYFWTSGLKCWKHASKMGYWINGTSDSLGDSSAKAIKNFIPNNTPHYKLSHSKALTKDYKLISTYSLETNEETIKGIRFKDKKYFYWMSPLQFDTVLEYYPEIINASHSSGFGKTYDYLKTKVPNPSNLKCFLSYEHWLSYYKIEDYNE